MQPSPSAQPKRYFVTGIGTDVGKTIVSAILTQALQADYWKPVQAGSLEATDTMRVQSLVSNSTSMFHPEAYRLELAASPHLAAAQEGIEIYLDSIQLPQTDNHLIVEGAGGVMVPLNNRELVLDLITKLKLEVILVSRNYLGSINHTLTTIEVLKSRGVTIAGIIFNGIPNPSTEEFIKNYTQLKVLPAVLEEESFTPELVEKYAQLFKNVF